LAVVVPQNAPKDLKGSPTAGTPAQPTGQGPQGSEGRDKDKEAKEAESRPVATGRKVIRSGDLEFEVDSFETAVATVARLVGEARTAGYVATINSDKLANGKVRGVVVLRLPPDRLDAFILALRKELGKAGELKSQRIGSQDITKQYTDLESRLRAARAMEERLLQIIKTGKGEIKDLLQAEKELGVWRTRIEEIEGELRYYANQVALSTLTITLTEKEIRAPFAIKETERIQMGIEVEDVDKAQRQALAAVAAAKGRITRSELKQYSAGQYSAVLNFEVPADAAGTLRDRLKQLGTVARLDIDRLLQPEGGSGPAPEARLTRSDAQFFVSIYNLANVAPRETVQLRLVCADVEAAYQAVLARARQATGRVVASNLNKQHSEQTSGTITLEVKTEEAEAVLGSLKDLGEVMSYQVIENADTQNVTRAKRGFQVTLVALGAVAPRETSVVQLAARDVPAAYHSLQEAVTRVKCRVVNAQLNEQDRQYVTAELDFEARRDEESAVNAALNAAGDVYSRTVTRSADADNVSDRKRRWQVRLLNLSAIQPRESVVLGIEVRDVDQAAAALSAHVAEAKGRVLQSQVSHERDGRVTAKLTFDVPLAAAAGLVERFKAAGTVRAQQSSRNPQVPESDLAVARLDVTLSNADLIVPSDEGLWPQIRTGLKTSFVAISWSLTVVIVGVCFVLPWAVVIYAGYLLVQRLRRGPASAAP
jgi:glycine cleavage system regulatory protein